MSKDCSLRLDVVPYKDNWGWQMFFRTHGVNQSISSIVQMPNVTSPSDIQATFEKEINSADISRIQAWGNKICKNIFPETILNEINSYDTGDILFMVPPDWADFPFELIHVSRGFLGEIFRIGTIIRVQVENKLERALSPQEIMLIIADPAENLPSAYKEGIELKEFAGKNNRKVRLITSADKTKILSEINKSSLVHFAGHSFIKKNRHSTGWEIAPDVLIDLADMEKIGESSQPPWLVFSNSCYAGNTGGDTDFSGIAGAFLKAGVSQVIGPVKKVNDIDALNFAKIFYSFLFKGMNPSESLLAAKQQNMKEGSRGITSFLYRLYGDPCFSIKGKKILLLSQVCCYLKNSLCF